MHTYIDSQLLEKILDVENVFIELFKPTCDFVLEGARIMGGLKDNKVLTQDKLCIRHNRNALNVIEVECYSNGRWAWYALSYNEFNKIKNFIQEIH